MHREVDRVSLSDDRQLLSHGCCVSHVVGTQWCRSVRRRTRVITAASASTCPVKRNCTTWQCRAAESRVTSSSASTLSAAVSVATASADSSVNKASLPLSLSLSVCLSAPLSSSPPPPWACVYSPGWLRTVRRSTSQCHADGRSCQNIEDG